MARRRVFCRNATRRLIPRDRAFRDRLHAAAGWARDVLGAGGRHPRPAGAVPARRTRGWRGCGAPPLLRSAFLAGGDLRSAGGRALPPAGQPGTEHHAGPGGRYRDAAPPFGHRALAAVRRLVGQYAGFGLCAGASRSGARAGIAGGVPGPPGRGGVVPARPVRGVSGRACSLRRPSADGRARRRSGRLFAPANRSRPGRAHVRRPGLVRL